MKIKEWEKQMAIDIKQVDYEEMYDYVFNLSQSLIQSTKEETIREVMELKCLKEENGIYNDKFGYQIRNPFRADDRNQLKNEIKEQIKSLLKE